MEQASVVALLQATIMEELVNTLMRKPPRHRTPEMPHLVEEMLELPEEELLEVEEMTPVQVPVLRMREIPVVLVWEVCLFMI